MRQQVRPWFLMAVLVALSVLAFGPTRASADFIDFDLTSSNLGSGFNGPFVHVTVNRTSSTTATFTFDALTNDGFTYLLTDGGSVAVNLNATSWTLGSISGTNSFGGSFTPGPYSDGGSGNEDGFGNFNQTINSQGSFTSSATQIIFSVTNTSGTWATASAVLIGNSQGNVAAAHVGTYDPETDPNGFVHGQTGFASGAGGGGGTIAPVPPSAVLMGLGALGLGGFSLWSRRRKVVPA